MRQKSYARLGRLIEQLENRQLLSAGTLDNSFSGDGKANASFDPTAVTGNGVAVQSDGKIVEVGGASDGLYAVVRFNTNGSLDTSFGPTGSGKLTDHIGTTGTTDNAFAVAIQSDGKIVVVGQISDDLSGTDKNAGAFVARYLPNGSHDTSFGSGGHVILDNFDSHSGFETAGKAVAIQKDGKIVIAGYQSQGIFSSNDNFILARLNTNGTADSSFNSDGELNLDLGENEDAEAIAIDYNDTPSTNPDYGNIVVVGHRNKQTPDSDPGGHPGDTDQVVIARYTTSGNLDKTFNGTGTLITSAGDTAKSTDAEAVAIESGGAIVIAGSAGLTVRLDPHNFFLARFTVKGVLDKTFGTNGNTTTDFGSDDFATSMVIGGFGQDLIAGGVTNGGFALAAYTLDGHLDAKFGNGGKTTVSFDGQSRIGLALGPNHTVVAGGGNDFNTARFFDIGPDVSVSSIDPTAGPTTSKIIGFKGKFPIVELVPNNASMIVAQDEKLSVNTRVFFTIGGNALPPNVANIKFKRNNYTVSGMTFEISPANSLIAYVDIPAGQTFTTVTFTPNIIPAATTTAIFSIQSNVNYQTSFPPSQTITLLGTNPAPASTTLTATADMYVQDGASANTNFGTATQLFVKKSSTTGSNQQTYLMFNLSSLSTVNSVKLTLFGALNSTAQASLVTQLFSVADTSWLETGMTWNKKRAVSASPLASATITGTTPQTYTFDVTAYVKAQLAAGKKIVSFALINPTASSPAILFNSREAASNKPTLTIT